jgi:hypothetical protein
MGVDKYLENSKITIWLRRRIYLLAGREHE